jgi:undecaprenyl-diphosphatase
MYSTLHWRTLFGVLALACAAQAQADNGPIGIDHPMTADGSGMWARPYQRAIAIGSLLTEFGGAFYLGNNDPLGHTFWQTLDANVVTTLTVQLLKNTTGRPRPGMNNDPDTWNQGGKCCVSFPSGEVAFQASFITPFIVNYGREHPAVYALEILPLYVGAARVKNQAHWQSDVLAGWIIGTASGYWASTRAIPFTVEVLPHGMSVGYHHDF